HLVLRLPQPHLVEDLPRVDDRRRRVDAEAAAHPEALEAGANGGVERGIGADAVEELRGVLEELRKLLLERADRAPLGAAEPDARAVAPRAAPGPDLLLVVARPDEEHELLLAIGTQDRHRLGLGESGEVEEVGGGAELEVDVVAPALDRVVREHG